MFSGIGLTLKRLSSRPHKNCVTVSLQSYETTLPVSLILYIFEALKVLFCSGTVVLYYAKGTTKILKSTSEKKG